ncbi:TonB-dependent receptor plug domain-containing protein [Pseudoalteromonas sp. SMS1]|uniref:TonB-dependent receptor plug domain-containing protein n=1 Tax=Pseudoalteromonas sp. SMS1 TaxID=2908894 RepID=UPI001F3C6722|nr:TonB-dependent receptor plug domain-containing protein [Pseudoalteromonas sp. SMS1]MCF2855957.1 TonB-dependent receptor plug domain-containing protein [Pseudoalteromonas sp. SMS1]
MKPIKVFKTNLITISLLSLLSPLSASVMAEETAQEIEEVVAVGSRLKGSASAVIEERKNQAFVADIMGSEQISRTGDSDAAAALRRVTGLSLVNDKFIYVRGLGERYSSVRLNGAQVPSPDLTRNVIPLDIFPSSIIESLAVQKAYSPDMPAAFGGGDVNIRTKSIPSDRVIKIEVGVAHKNTNDKGFVYNGSDDDWLGEDDGLRAMPTAMTNALNRYVNGISDISVLNIRSVESKERGTDISQDEAIAINKTLTKSLHRDFGMVEKSLDPDVGGKLVYGDRFDDVFGLGGSLGFLISAAYDHEWSHSKGFTAVLSSTEVKTEECGKSDLACYSSRNDKESTKKNVKLNTSFNLGYKLDGHDLNASYMKLKDTEDEASVSLYQEPSKSLSIASGEIQRKNLTSFEERELEVLQFRGTHNIEYDFIKGVGFDWHYTDSTATTNIPSELEITARDRYTDGVYTETYTSGALGGDPFLYRFVDMEDKVENFGWNLSKAFYFDSSEIELKGGGYFVDKTREYRTDFFKYRFGPTEELTLATNRNEALGIGSYFRDDARVDSTEVEIQFQEPNADDYIAAQKIDAYYGSFDYVFANDWRVSGGLRYEDFRQVALAYSRSAFDPALLQNKLSAEAIQKATVMQDDTFGSLSMTYSQPTYQIRAGWGQTIVRPDLRELTPVQYQDPLTDYRTLGNPTLVSSNLDNFDVRVEFYFESGDNFSVGAFYKDIDKPIEAQLNERDGRFTLEFENADSAYVYGIEAEWLVELSSDFLGGAFFTSGNLTMSDSEVEILESARGDLTNLKRRMTGHSEYVANLQLNYDSHDGNHQASVIYNVFGDRILAAGVNGFDDAYEQPINSLDLVYSYYPTFSTTVTFKVKNLLDQDFEVEQNDVLIRQKETAQQVSLDFAIEF